MYTHMNDMICNAKKNLTTVLRQAPVPANVIGLIGLAEVANNDYGLSRADYRGDRTRRVPVLPSTVETKTEVRDQCLFIKSAHAPKASLSLSLSVSLSLSLPSLAVFSSLFFTHSLFVNYHLLFSCS